MAMIRIYCKNNGITKEFESGLTLKEIYDGLGLDMPYGVVAAKVNNVSKIKIYLSQPMSTETIY